MTKIAHVIPLAKGFVHGYYEKRNGKMVWVSPYSNSRAKEEKPGLPDVQELDGGMEGVKKPDVPTVSGRVPTKPVNVNQSSPQSVNYILDAIIGMVKTINKFEAGEVIRLHSALKTCRSIVRELGFMDETIEPYFSVPKGKMTRLGRKAERETSAMAKEAKLLSRRITKATLREKVQTLSEQLGDAL